MHVETFHYDEQAQFMLSCYYLFAYQGGDILPGDDMIGSDYRWWSMAELTEDVNFYPSTKSWILKRAVDLYRLWLKEPDVPLQQALQV